MHHQRSCRTILSVSNAHKLVNDLRHQVQHYKALSKANSDANSDADSHDESEGNWNSWEDNGSAAVAVNNAHCSSCVSSITGVVSSFSTPAVVPKYFSVAKVFKSVKIYLLSRLNCGKSENHTCAQTTNCV